MAATFIKSQFEGWKKKSTFMKILKKSSLTKFCLTNVRDYFASLIKYMANLKTIFSCWHQRNKTIWREGENLEIYSHRSLINKLNTGVYAFICFIFRISRLKQGLGKILFNDFFCLPIVWLCNVSLVQTVILLYISCICIKKKFCGFFNIKNK